MKKRWRKNDRNRPSPVHGPKYAKYEMYLSIIKVICIKQHQT